MKVLVVGSGSLARAVLLEGLRRPALTMYGIRGYVAAIDTHVLNGALEECDVVINAHGANPKRGATAEEYLDQSVAPASKIATMARKHRIPSVHVSTDCVLGRMGGALGADPAPDDLYGYAMAFREELVIQGGGTAVRTSFVTPREGVWRDVSTLETFAGWTGASWSGTDVASVATKFLEIAVGLPPFGNVSGVILKTATADPITKFQVANHLIKTLAYPCKLQYDFQRRVDRTMVASPGCELPDFLQRGTRYLEDVKTQQLVATSRITGPEAWAKIWRYGDPPDEHREHSNA